MMNDPAEPVDEPNEEPAPVANEGAAGEVEVPEPEELHTKEELRLALKAFRKRLRLTRLDDESRMGYGPTSSGQSSGIVAVTPPNQFPATVWQELAKQGKIKRAGGTLYSLVE